MQSKRSDCMVRSNTRELLYGANLNVPYHRFPITARARSDQHDMLVELDNGAACEVFYAAPRFHEVGELNDAYLAKSVANRSFYIRPRDIGLFPDDDAHHVAFDGTRHYICSEPREVKAVRGRAVFDELRNRLQTDDRPLRAGIIARAIGAAERSISRRKLQPRTRDGDDRGKDDEKMELQRLADLSLRFFGAQLFVVQPAATVG